MAISGHRSQVSLRNYISRPSREQLRACSDILSDALSGRPQQSLQPGFTVLSSLAIFMFRKIWLSFIHKTQAWMVCFLIVVKKLACFYEPDFTEHFTFRFSIRDWKAQAKELNSTRWTPRFVSYRRMWTLMVFFLTLMVWRFLQL